MNTDPRAIVDAALWAGFITGAVAGTLATSGLLCIARMAALRWRIHACRAHVRVTFNAACRPGRATTPFKTRQS
jgi:hypothetical protein